MYATQQTAQKVSFLDCEKKRKKRKSVNFRDHSSSFCPEVLNYWGHIFINNVMLYVYVIVSERQCKLAIW